MVVRMALRKVMLLRELAGNPRMTQREIAEKRASGPARSAPCTTGESSVSSWTRSTISARFSKLPAGRLLFERVEVKER